jgi:quinol monooxygenase YgiN
MAANNGCHCYNRRKDETILDAGYVSLVETWGSDERIIEAARMSTGIRQYADAVGELIAEAFPHTWALFAKDQNHG